MSFITERRSKGRRHTFSKKYRKKILLDENSEPFFALEKDDVSVCIGVSLPRSLVIELDKALNRLRYEPDIKKRKEGLSRSRYIRFLIEKDLSVDFSAGL